MVGNGVEGSVVAFGIRRWNIAPFIQDDIRVNDRLTLNAGLRYKYQSVPYEIENRLGGIMDEGPLRGNLVLNPSPVYQPDRLNFAPRIGFFQGDKQHRASRRLRYLHQPHSHRLS